MHNVERKTQQIQTRKLRRHENIKKTQKHLHSQHLLHFEIQQNHNLDED